ncbi:MAG: hypothetical protein WB763_18735 [Terriglobia bacterium]|jgi:hypothetical protein
MKPQPPWEDESGVLVLRLYKSDKYGPWLKDVNKAHLHPDWPRIVVLDLSADQFKEFDQNSLAFAKKYNLFPEQPILWTSPCAKPPIGEGIPRAAESSRYTLVGVHGSFSMFACAACPQSFIR